MREKPRDHRKVARKVARTRNGNVNAQMLRELCGLLVVSRINAREARS